ncbi:CoA transferase [Aurantivibrio plasticivorans]
MNSLLSGIKVLDFSEYIAGPYCGFLLADVGADVIKIEPPDGAEERRLGSPVRYRGNTRMSLAFNRGKKSLSVDLKSEEGRSIVHELVKTADVVVQNFVPGASDRLGIDYDTLRAINPQIIFLSSTAFGEVGPYRSRKGFDIIAHAASGIMSNYADGQAEPRGPGGLPYIDISTGIYNAFAIASALFHRLKTGEGQKIESSLFSTGMALQMIGLVNIDELDESMTSHEREVLDDLPNSHKSHTDIIDEFANARLRSEQPDTARPIEVPECSHRPTDLHVYPYYRTYRTASGYISIAALNTPQRKKLCELLALEDPFQDMSFGSISDEAYFAQKRLMLQIEESLKAESNDYWLEKLEAAGVPCGQVNYRPDMYEDPQANALGMLWQLENSDLGGYTTVGHPIRYSKTPVEPNRGAPTLGEDSRAVLLEQGYDQEQIDQWLEKGVIRVASKPDAQGTN